MTKRNTSKPIEIAATMPAAQTPPAKAEPMETQPASAGWRNTAMPMGSQPSKKSKAVRAPTIPPADAEGTRQSSLKKQRGQIAAVRKKRNGARVPPGGK